MRYLRSQLAGRTVPRHLRSRRLHILLGAALAAGAISTSSAQAADYSDIARNVLAPGQAGSVPTSPNSTDQLALYDGLTPLGFNVSAADVNRFYKPNVFGTRGQGPMHVETTPNKNVRIVRDKWDVPHVTGKKRADVMYGAGFVAAEDRQLLLELGRGPGRLAILDAPGIDAFRLIVTGRTFIPSAQADAVINRQTNVLRRAGSKGRQTLSDMDDYVRGMNGFFTQSGQIQSGAVKPWTRTDMLALSGFIGSIFGRGGGGEHQNPQFLGALQPKLGDAAGRSVFDDLRRVTDPESPASLETPKPYNEPPANRSGNAKLDEGS